MISNFLKLIKKEEKGIKKFDRDFWHHLILVLILAFSLSLFMYFSYSRVMQFFIGMVSAIAYVLWGFIHHKLDGDLHFKNMVEYIFIAVFSVVILGGMLL